MILLKATDHVIDRYTLVTDEGDVYAFSDNPFHPLGVGMYCFSFTNTENIEQWMRNHTESGRQKEIQYGDLSKDAQKFVDMQTK